MADDISLARPYARAAFECAREKNTLSAWQHTLQTAAWLCQDKEIYRALKNAFIHKTEKASWFVETCQGQENQEISRFIHLLAENNRLLLLPALVMLFQQYVNELEHAENITIVTAYQLNEHQLAVLRERVAQSIGKKDVLLEQQQQPSLMGGVQIHGKGWVIDASIRGKLHKLARSLAV